MGCITKLLLAGLLVISRVALAQPPPPNGCVVTGTNPVTVGDTWTYTISSACPASSWTATCGTIQSSTSTTVTVYFNVLGSCSSSTISAKNSSGGTLASKTVTVNQPPALVCGSISNPTQTINYNTTPAQISAGASSGGNCGSSYNYQWYSSTNGTTYTAISGATGQNYQPGSLTVTTYYYRTTTCEVQNCTTSNTATVTVYPQLQPGSVSPSSETINYNASAGTLSVTGISGGAGAGSYTYQWWSSPNGTSYSSISGATSSSYVPGNLTATTYYRCEVSSNGVNANSTAGLVTVYPLIQGTLSPATQVVYYDDPCDTIKLGSVSGGNGSYTYQWQDSSASTGGSWVNVSGATGTSYFPGDVTALTYYRVIITSNGDPVASSVAWVKPALYAGELVPDALTITSGTNPGQLDADPASGGSSPGNYSYQWQDSSASTGGNWNNVSGATSQDYSPGALTSNIWYRRQVTSGSDVAYTNVCQITVGSSSTNLNFIKRRSILKAGITDTVTADELTSPYDVAQTTQYYDGMGRPVQTVAMQASPLQNDMVSPVVFDNFGRQSIHYMPYTATTNDGNYKATALIDQQTFNSAQFPGEQYYYAQTNYEASPENRVLNTYAPGLSWVGNNTGVSSEYLVNTAGDSVQIWSISSTQLSIPANGGAYAAGQLYKTLATDEQGHQLVEYKDKLGKTILKKVQQSASPSSGHAGWLCTYYVYDTLQNLRVVIQPQAIALINGSWTISQSIANELCFRYEYDGRRRPAIKKAPGAGQVWMVYDARDRMAMTQDSATRSLHKWMFIKYDSENRPDSTGFITDPSNYNNLAYHDTLAYYSTSYPAVSSYTNELLSQKFYDDYSWVSTYSAPVSSSMATNYTGNSNYFITSYNTSPTYAVAITPFPITRGMSTGSMKKVLGTTSQYLYAVCFFDDRGRVIQTQSENYTGAIDTVTMQYNFEGGVLRTLVNHQKKGNTVQNHVVVTKMDYDHRLRLKHIWKNIDNAGSDQLIDSLQYNELGQLSAKYLGSLVDSVIYSYNVRGWLTGINKNYVAGTTSHYFGMELGYDKTTSVAPGNTYLTPEYNGDIEGVVWKSAGSGINRKYDFTYDNANRLSAAAFLQNTSGSSWDKTQIDYSVSGLSYDANGNILTLTQRGFTVGGSAPIDSLTYSYLNTDNSNKLMGVTDAVNNPTSLLEDFHYNPATKQATDYNYDGNGNLTHDNNRNIDTISYNYLNLPILVHMNGEGNVAYTYDAGGTKLSKVITDSVAKHSTTILYVSGFVYQQTDTIISPGGGADTLQFVGHEEGRSRWAYHKYTSGATAYKFEYDFFEKDHLGNTRMVLTQERDTSNYLASMEAAYRPTEVQLFGNIANTCYPRASVSGYPNDHTYTNPNDSVSRVDSSSSGGQKMGPNLLLKVMTGDTVKLSVQCYYNSGSGSTNNSSFSDVLNSLANGLVNATGGAHGNLSNLTSSGSTVYTGLTSFLGSNDLAPSGYPKAYLNWIFLDDQFNYVSGLSGSVQAASSTYPAATLNTVAPGSQVALNRSGYLYIWVSNETQGWDVFFDNLSVQYKQGPVLEENHYYPFGLTMAGISDKAIKTQYAENKYRYDGGAELQNKEFSDGSGLELYETSFRSFDPQVGRFFQMDPLVDKYQSLTTYQYAGDNPILNNDPSGSTFAPNVSHGQGGNPGPIPEAVFDGMDNGDGGDFLYGGASGGALAGGPGSNSGMGSIYQGDGTYMLPGGQIVDQATALAYALSRFGGGMVTLNGDAALLYLNSMVAGLTIQDGESDPDNGLPGAKHTNVNGMGVVWADNVYDRDVLMQDGTSVYYHGEQMAVDVNVSSQDFAAYNWIQDIDDGTPNEHLDGSKDNQGNLVNSPFYYGPGDVNQNFSVWGPGTPASFFGDQPGTPKENLTWTAQATLVGINSQGQLTPLLTVNWGYTVTYGTVWLIPVSFSVNPSATTQNYINQYNQQKSSQ
jgi:RHS repeat-associated protein